MKDLLENLKRIISRIEENELMNCFPSAYERAKKAITKAEEWKVPLELREEWKEELNQSIKKATKRAIIIEQKEILMDALKMVVDDIEKNSELTTETAAHVTKLYYSLKD